MLVVELTVVEQEEEDVTITRRTSWRYDGDKSKRDLPSPLLVNCHPGGARGKKTKQNTRYEPPIDTPCSVDYSCDIQCMQCFKRQTAAAHSILDTSSIHATLARNKTAKGR